MTYIFALAPAPECVSTPSLPKHLCQYCEGVPRTEFKSACTTESRAQKHALQSRPFYLPSNEFPDTLTLTASWTVMTSATLPPSPTNVLFSMRTSASPSAPSIQKK
jgi:hypothetical protein